MTTNQAVKYIQKTFDVNSIYAQRLYFIADKTNLDEDISRIIREKPKPFVKWVGGKRQLLQQFRKLDLYPPEGFNIVTGTYFEPFVGGGAVFFDLLPQNAVLSDLNQDLIITYKEIKNNVSGLVQSLKKHIYDKNYFLGIRSQNPRDLTDTEIASRFIFLNRTCFNGMYRVNSKGEFNVPFGKYSNPVICDEGNLMRVSKALKNIELKFEDYKQTVKAAKKGDFIYFDPPYYPKSKTSSFTSYTLESFLEKEQIELRDTFLELHKRGCFVMLSNSDTPFINSIYSQIKKFGVKVIKVQAGRSINSKGEGRGKITEILVTNY